MSNIFVKEDGSLIEVEYDSSIHKIGKDAAQNTIKTLLNTYKPIGAEIEITPESINDEFQVKISITPDNEKVFYLGIGDTQSGGNKRPPDEHRIQLNGQLYNDLYLKRESGCNAILLGVYRWNSFKILGDGLDIDQFVICSWTPTPTESTSPLSKQIKAKTISEAITNGFARYQGSNFTACAFRPELLYYYLNNSEKLHNEIEAQEKEIEMKAFENFEYRAINENKEKSFNKIVFGAPGTGKSHQLNLAKDKLPEIDEFERVTFHPNYSYAQFVGTYKPVTKDDGDIAYRYVEGPFMRLLTAALENAKDSNKENRKRYLLIIEEINRANVAAVFGDMFQLLDRDTDGVSDYEIQTSEDVRNYLAAKLGGDGLEDKYKTLKLPNNFYIWATMNSADQGVMPMDAAFKRRWEFEYLDVDNKDAVDKIKHIDIPITRDGSKTVKWNDFRVALNEKLSGLNINEDKLLGPFFLSKQSLETATNDANHFVDLFESKVIMYLFEDVVKMQPGKLFTTGTRRYSKLCKEFEEKGMELFGIDVEVTSTATGTAAESETPAEEQ